MRHYLEHQDQEAPHALPAIEAWEAEVWNLTCSRGCGEFEVSEGHATAAAPDCICPSCEHNSGQAEATGKHKWFAWVCLPGCLPDSDEYGPFDTEQEAVDAINNY